MNQPTVKGLALASIIALTAGIVFHTTKHPFQTSNQSASAIPDEFLAAIQNRDRDTVERYLKQGLDPNGNTCTDCENPTPLLHLLTTWPTRVDPAMLDLLIAYGADVNAPNADGETLLHQLSQELKTPEDWVSDIGAQLIAHGADVNARDRQNRTVLETALCAEVPSQGLVAALVEHGADTAALDAQSLCGTTVLHLAARANHPGLVDWALSQGVAINALDASGNTALHELRGPAAGDSLLANAANLTALNGAGQSPLETAVCLHGGWNTQKAEVIDWFLRNGAESQTLPLNLDCGFGPTTLLNEAIGSDSAALAEVAIANGSDINSHDDQGQTPLHQAGRVNATRVAAVLLAAQADINAVDDQGYTPLHWAVIHRNLAITQLLIDQGANVNAVDSEGHTPLFEAENPFWDDSLQTQNLDDSQALVELLQASGGKT
jgi:ankyrin repeat protein